MLHHVCVRNVFVQVGVVCCGGEVVGCGNGLYAGVDVCILLYSLPSLLRCRSAVGPCCVRVILARLWFCCRLCRVCHRCCHSNVKGAFNTVLQFIAEVDNPEQESLESYVSALTCLHLRCSAQGEIGRGVRSMLMMWSVRLSCS
jgi:hypothetical protein